MSLCVCVCACACLSECMCVCVKDILMHEIAWWWEMGEGGCKCPIVVVVLYVNYYCTTLGATVLPVVYAL